MFLEMPVQMYSYFKREITMVTCTTLLLTLVCSGPNGVLITKVPLYRTVYCGPNGVLTREVPLYRTVYCGPNGVLIIEVPLYRTVYCGLTVSLL